MSFTTVTPYMNLTLPEPTLELGPAWASELNAALFLVDSHNHTSGQGEPVPSAGLNINADVNFNGNNLTNARSIRFQNQTSPLSLSTDIGCIYESGGDFYYNNSIGQQVKITSGASLNAASIGGIGGDYVSSGALVFYTSATSSYSMTTDGTNFANLWSGALRIYPTGTSSHYVQIQAPGSLSANYILTLPTANPSTTSLLQVSSTGVMSYAALSGGGIPGSTITPGTITPTQIQTRALAASPNFSHSTNSTSGLVISTLTQTFVGNACYIGICPGSPHFSLAIIDGATGVAGHLYIYIDGGTSYGWDFNNGSNNVVGDGGALFSCPGPLFLVSGLSPGSHTLTLVAQVDNASTTISLSNAVFYVNEIV